MVTRSYELEGAFLPEQIDILKSVGVNLTPNYSAYDNGQRILDPYYDVPCHSTENINDREPWGIFQGTLVFVCNIPIDRIPQYLVHSRTHDIPGISKDPMIGALVWKDVVLPILKKRLERGE